MKEAGIRNLATPEQIKARGVAFYKNGEYKTALTTFKAALQKVPTQAGQENIDLEIPILSNIA